MKNYIMALVMILAASGLAFGQADVETVCPDPCHVAPYFKGSGGFVGERAMADDAKTMDKDEGAVSFVVTCGNVTTTGTAPADAEGIVRQAFSMENGLACGEADGKIEISNLKAGGWYWIHDGINAAVSSLVNTGVLKNAQVAPTDPGGVTITKMGKDGAASFVKHESGMVGIIPHIHPTAPMAPCAATGPTNNCVVNASYSIKLTTGTGAAAKPVGATVTRGAADIVVTPGIDAKGNLKTGSGQAFTVEGANKDLGINADAATGAVTITPEDKGRCAADNIDRGTAIKVTVKVSTAMQDGYIPALPEKVADASFMVACPALTAASSSQGVDLVPENPFPTDR